MAFRCVRYACCSAAIWSSAATASFAEQDQEPMPSIAATNGLRMIDVFIMKAFRIWMPDSELAP
ncbi:hypothetical protein XthCFBP4691_13995 [Xanthomonas theicola]|uniref:Uncharacterized protein n=2 Tax=Xanthomonas theicola TaxID=56464 RepID=A0A2S6ZDA6_9XANT|nr:hypothetical protein XthCFBP4691_13995 [Xanthomonas theicola]